MSCYVSSKENRYYTALEQSFGTAASMTEDNRVPGVKLEASQRLENAERRDKTGSRTFVGMPDGLRKQTSFIYTLGYSQAYCASLPVPPFLVRKEFYRK